MSDLDSMSRENRKRQLRQSMVSSESESEWNRSQHDEDGGEGPRRPGRVGKRRRLTVLLMILLVLTAVGFGGYQYFKYCKYTGYTSLWEAPASEGSFAGYESFGGNVLKYTRDGASYINSRGETGWTDPYEMKSPVIAVSGDYAAIADKQGNQLYIYDKMGRRGTAKTLLPIMRVTISQTGIAVVIMEDTKASYIQFYDVDGRAMDISIKSVLSGDGYPIDVSISPDGTQIISSFVYLSNGEPKNKVVFYDFSEIGKNEGNKVGGFNDASEAQEDASQSEKTGSDAPEPAESDTSANGGEPKPGEIEGTVVGGFNDEFGSSLVPRVVYFKDLYSCAFADDGLTFFSSKKLDSPEIIRQEKIEEQIRGVFYSDKYVGVIVDTASGDFPNRMDIYKINGDKVFSKAFDYQYRQADIDGEHVFLYNENSCRIYNMAGVEKFAGEFDVPVSKIVEGRFPNTFIVTGSQTMKEIKLQ